MTNENASPAEITVCRTGGLTELSLASPVNLLPTDPQADDAYQHLHRYLRYAFAHRAGWRRVDVDRMDASGGRPQDWDRDATVAAIAVEAWLKNNAGILARHDIEGGA